MNMYTMLINVNTMRSKEKRKKIKNPVYQVTTPFLVVCLGGVGLLHCIITAKMSVFMTIWQRWRINEGKTKINIFIHLHCIHIHLYFIQRFLFTFYVLLKDVNFITTYTSMTYMFLVKDFHFKNCYSNTLIFR